MISTTNYNYQKWSEIFKNDVDFSLIPIYTNWNNIISPMLEHGKFKMIENKINEEIENNKDIFPYPHLIFNSLNELNIDDVRVVILGQDPYFHSEIHHNKKIPQTMGLAFSIPKGITIPPSLSNIFKNQKEFGIIEKKQPHGNLQYWSQQGCLLLNTAFTVREFTPCSHYHLWQPISNKIISYISKELNDIIFVLWGSSALSKINLINKDKHHLIISSHPSGLSYNNPLKQYKSFANTDHFNLINNYLIQNDLKPIDWQLVNI